MEYVDSKVDALTQIVRTHQHKLNSVTDNYVPEERITGRKKSNKGHCCCRGCCCNAFVRQVWSIPWRYFRLGLWLVVRAGRCEVRNPTGQKIFSVYIPAILSVGPVQFPVQWLPGFFPRGKAARAWCSAYLHLSTCLGVNTRTAVPVLSLYAFLAWIRTTFIS